MGTAEDPAVGLYAMPDHPATAVLAARRQSVYRALEAVEGARLLTAHHLKRLVVLVSANVAFGHARELPGGLAGKPSYSA